MRRTTVYINEQLNRNRPLLFVLMLALSVRIIYLILAVNLHGIDHLVSYFPDTDFYRTVMRYILTGDSAGESMLFQTGPCYGMILAMFNLIFGDSYYPPLIFNLITGIISSILVYMLANALIENKQIALISGIIAALSPTSIVLSCNLLSDQPFVAFHLAALLMFVTGLKGGKMSRFVFAGLLAGFGAYIRAAAIFWPFLFLIIPLIIPLPERFKSRKELFLKAAITSVILATLIAGWSVRNLIKYDLFTYSGNGVKVARLYLAADAVSAHSMDADIFSVRETWSREDSVFFDGNQPSINAEYKRNKNHLLEIVHSHLDWILASYLNSVKSNMLAGNQLATKQLPVLNEARTKFNVIGGKWLYHLVYIITSIGLLLLIAAKKRTAWMILGMTWIYFTLITGVSFWQGSRLHYPAEMAGAILLACGIHGAYRLIIRIFPIEVKTESN